MNHVKEKSFPEDLAHENGNYTCRCTFCKDYFQGYKRRVVCKLCQEHMNTEEINPLGQDSPQGENPIHKLIKSENGRDIYMTKEEQAKKEQEELKFSMSKMSSRPILPSKTIYVSEVQKLIEEMERAIVKLETMNTNYIQGWNAGLGLFVDKLKDLVK